MAGADEASRLRAQIGVAIRRAREQAGVGNQEALGDLVGAAQSTVSRWERGAAEGVLTLDDVIALEEALHLNRGELLIAGGYVPMVDSAEQALKVDPRITDRLDRHGILSLYRILVERGPQLPG